MAESYGLALDIILLRLTPVVPLWSAECCVWSAGCSIYAQQPTSPCIQYTHSSPPRHIFNIRTAAHPTMASIYAQQPTPPCVQYTHSSPTRQSTLPDPDSVELRAEVMILRRARTHSHTSSIRFPSQAEYAAASDAAGDGAGGRGRDGGRREPRGAPSLTPQPPAITHSPSLTLL
jgi:hypothetical protein